MDHDETGGAFEALPTSHEGSRAADLSAIDCSEDAFDARGAHGEDEFAIPELFPPCREWNSRDGYCLNMSRSIRFVRTNGGKQLICGQYHALLHNGKPFIPAHEFAEGGAFSGVLPPELMPSEFTMKDSRWKPSHQAVLRLSEFTVCARCGAPPYKAYKNTDTADLWVWIVEFDKDLIKSVHSELRKWPGIHIRDWYAALSVPLRTTIVARLEQSILQIDHGIPRKVGNVMWPLLSANERLFLQETLLFMLCKKDNTRKSSKLIPLEELTQMYIAALYGSLAVAKGDAARWALFESVVIKAYGKRSTRLSLP